jgi:hypothetical protein
LLQLPVRPRESREFALLVPNPEAANRRSSAQESQRADECEFCQTNRNQERHSVYAHIGNHANAEYDADQQSNSHEDGAESLQVWTSGARAFARRSMVKKRRAIATATANATTMDPVSGRRKTVDGEPARDCRIPGNTVATTLATARMIAIRIGQLFIEPCVCVMR